jgi:hypothetical protein
VPLAREAEEAFIGAMFQNLGRLLTEYYFPEEARPDPPAGAAGHRAQRGAGRGDGGAARAGTVLRDIGQGVAKAWGLPDTLQRAMRVPEGEPPSRPVGRNGQDRQRWLGRMATEVADAMLGSDGDAQTAALHAEADRYAQVLGVPARKIVSSTLESREQLRQLASAMGLQVAPGAPARRLLEATMPMGTQDTHALRAHDKTLIEVRPEPLAPQVALNRGLSELRAALAGNPLRLGEVLNLVLDTMHRALDFRWVVLCLRDAKTGQLAGRLGLGPGVADISPAFRITLGGATHGDLFAALCAKGADMLIKDATAVVGHLPHWYRQRVNAGSFMAMPLQLNGRCIGLIYADKMSAGSIVLHEGELVALRALRDEAVAAFRRGQ